MVTGGKNLEKKQGGGKRVVFGLLIFFALFALFFLVQGIPNLGSMIIVALHIKVDAFVIGLVAFVMLLPIAFSIWWMAHLKMAEWKLKNLWQNWWKILLTVVLILAVNRLFQYILTSVGMGITTTVNQQAVETSQAALPFIFTFITVCIAAPIMEEFIFRGVIFERILLNHSKAAFIVSTILFAAVHVANELLNWKSWILYLVMSAGFGLLYYHTRKIETSIAAHFINNAIALLLPILLSIMK